MANTCFTTVRVRSGEAGIKNISDAFSAAFPSFRNAGTAGSGEALWTGELWKSLGIEDPAKHGKCASEIDTVFNDAAHGCISFFILSKWNPQLGPVRDFCRKHDPDCTIEFFGSEPMTNLYVSNVPGTVCVEFDLTDAEWDDPANAFLRDWDPVMTESECAAKMAEAVGADPNLGLDGIAEIFCGKYDVRVIKFAQTSLDEVC